MTQFSVNCASSCNSAKSKSHQVTSMAIITSDNNNNNNNDRARCAVARQNLSLLRAITSEQHSADHNDNNNSKKKNVYIKSSSSKACASHRILFMFMFIVILTLMDTGNLMTTLSSSFDGRHQSGANTLLVEGADSVGTANVQKFHPNGRYGRRSSNDFVDRLRQEAPHLGLRLSNTIGGDVTTANNRAAAHNAVQATQHQSMFSGLTSPLERSTITTSSSNNNNELMNHNVALNSVVTDTDTDTDTNSNTALRDSLFYGADGTESPFTGRINSAAINRQQQEQPIDARRVFRVPTIRAARDTCLRSPSCHYTGVSNLYQC